MRLSALLLLALWGCCAGCHRDDLTDAAAVRAKLNTIADGAARYASRQKNPPLYPMSSAEWAPRGRLCTAGEQLISSDPDAWEQSPWVWRIEFERIEKGA